MTGKHTELLVTKVFVSGVTVSGVTFLWYFRVRVISLGPFLVSGVTLEKSNTTDSNEIYVTEFGVFSGI